MIPVVATVWHERKESDVGLCTYLYNRNAGLTYTFFT